MEKFKIGDRVGMESAANRHGDMHMGVVDDLTKKGLFVVKWDDPYFQKHYPGPFSADELDTEENLNKLCETLEADFEKTSKKVKDLLDKSASFLNEAAKVAREANGSLSDDFYDEADLFMSAMNNAGWRSSSLNC